MYSIHMLAADHGDCLWIEYGNPDAPKRILIDAGTSSTYKKSLLPKIEKVIEAEGSCKFELFVITHIDADHIGGAFEFLKNSKKNKVSINHIWFNGYYHLSNKSPNFLGAKQAEKLTPLVQEGPWKWNEHFSQLAVMVKDNEELPIFNISGMKITLLSPTFEQLQNLKPKWEKELAKAGLVAGGAYLIDEVLPDGFLGGEIEDWADTEFREDKAEANGSSIAFVAEYEEKKVLFSGDAFPSVLINSLNREPLTTTKFPLNAFKLPHHASKNNISKELIEAFPAENYLISTNGNQFKHPDKQAIARILTSNDSAKKLQFNYRSEFNEIWGNISYTTNWNYQAQFGTFTDGLTIKL